MAIAATPKKTQMKEDDVTWGIIDSKDHPDFKKVYKKYQESFTLKTEQESRANFEAILDDNKNTDKPGKEMWVYAKDKNTGEIIGANNFDAFKARPGHGVDVAAINIYMFVDKNHREQGVFKLLQKKTEEAAALYVNSIDSSIPATTDKVVTFAEQNQPLLMTPNEIIADSKSASINQSSRRIAFEREGFATLDMRYVQPPLQSEQEAKAEGTVPETCDYLQAVAKVPKGMGGVPTAVVEGFYEDFFAKSFPEGTSLKMQALQGMQKDIEASKKEGGVILLSDSGKFEALHQHVSIEALSKLPKAQRDTVLGELRPDLVQQYYGSKDANIDAVKDSITTLRDQTGQGNGSPAQALRTAMASQDVNGIIAAINNGAPPPMNAAFLKLAEATPALAGIPAIASALAAQSNKQAPTPPVKEEVAPDAQTIPRTVTTANPQGKTEAAPARPASPMPAAMKTALAAAAQKIKKTPQVSNGGAVDGTLPTRAQNPDGKLPGADTKKGQGGGIGG